MDKCKCCYRTYDGTDQCNDCLEHEVARLEAENKELEKDRDEWHALACDLTRELNKANTEFLREHKKGCKKGA